MTAENFIVPDLLQRFVATPHVCTICKAKERIRIESNDLELACGVLKLCRASGNEGPTGAVYWKMIRDEIAPRDDGDPTVLLTGPLSTLLVGTGTILTFDRERREILGFLAPGITVERFVSELVPLLLGAPYHGATVRHRAVAEQNEQPELQIK